MPCCFSYRVQVTHLREPESLTLQKDGQTRFYRARTLEGVVVSGFSRRQLCLRVRETRFQRRAATLAHPISGEICLWFQNRGGVPRQKRPRTLEAVLQGARSSLFGCHPSHAGTKTNGVSGIILQGGGF